jgi:hypothetical protein
MSLIEQSKKLEFLPVDEFIALRCCDSCTKVCYAGMTQTTQLMTHLQHGSSRHNSVIASVSRLHHWEQDSVNDTDGLLDSIETRTYAVCLSALLLMMFYIHRASKMPVITLENSIVLNCTHLLQLLERG